MGGNNLKRLVLFLLLFAGLIFGVNIPVPEAEEDYQELHPGVVTEENSSETTESGDSPTVTQILTVEVNSGSEEHQTLTIENSDTAGSDARLFHVGDKVYVAEIQIPDQAPQYTIADYDRRMPLYILFGIFCLIVVMISGKQGVESFLGMVFSFGVLLKIILPLLILGVDPVLSALAGSALIIPSTFYLSQ